jgi:uncharacterized protein YbaP (TraB family)
MRVDEASRRGGKSKGIVFLLVWMLCLFHVNSRAQSAESEGCIYPVPQRDAAYWQKEAAVAKDKGLLWRLEKDGRTSWLLGTLHINRPQTAMLGPRIMQAILSSDVLAVELNISEAGVLQKLLKSTAEPLPKISPSTTLAVQEVLKKACHPQVNQLDVIGKNMLIPSLLLSYAKSLGLYAEYGVDLLLMGMAQAMKKPIHSLESVDVQAQVLRLIASAPDFEQSLKEHFQSIDSGQTKRLFDRFYDVWLRGDAAENAQYPMWCDCRENEEEKELFKRINDDRNPGLATEILRLHDQGKRVFAAVGMAHTSGPLAVQTLLAQAGFVVTFIPINNQKSGQ